MTNSGKSLIKFLTVIIILITAVVITNNALAETECPKDTICTKLIVPIPGVPGTIVNPGDYILGVYRFGIGLAGLSAMLIIVYAGIKWTASAGNQSAISEAKDMVTNAVLGLAILLGAFLILNTINPKLTVVSLPGFEKIKATDKNPFMALATYHEITSAAHAAGDAEINEQKVLNDPKSSPLQRAEATLNADTKELVYYEKLVLEERKRFSDLTEAYKKSGASIGRGGVEYGGNLDLRSQRDSAKQALDSYTRSRDSTKQRTQKSQEAVNTFINF